VLLALVLAAMPEPKIGLNPDPAHKLGDPVMLFAGYVLMVGLLQPLLPALLLLMVTTGQGGGWQRLTRVLSAPAFLSFASITYDIYLLHVLVRCPPYHTNVLSAWNTGLWASTLKHLLFSGS
jgi:peptidoglycan/LPS O-acetylase OafA/YrhL